MVLRPVKEVQRLVESATSADSIYIEIFAWPKGNCYFEKLPRTVTSAYLLANKARKPLKITKTA